jgi:hypothetical protein
MNIKQIIKEEIQAVLRVDESSGRMREAQSAISHASRALSDLERVEGLPIDVYETAKSMKTRLAELNERLDVFEDYDDYD